MSLIFSSFIFYYYWLDSPSVAIFFLSVMVEVEILTFSVDMTKNNSDKVLPHIFAWASCLPHLDRVWELLFLTPILTLVFSFVFSYSYLCWIFVFSCSVSLFHLLHNLLYFFLFMHSFFSSFCFF